MDIETLPLRKEELTIITSSSDYNLGIKRKYSCVYNVHHKHRSMKIQQQMALRQPIILQSSVGTGISDIFQEHLITRIVIIVAYYSFDSGPGKLRCSFSKNLMGKYIKKR